MIRPDGALDIPEGARVRLTVEPEPPPREPSAPSSADERRTRRLEWTLFALALLVYAFTRLWALERFPIYFFADEATHAVLASDLIDSGFKDGQGRLLPLYFEAAGLRWTPLLSVYVHVLPVAVLGKSIAVTRATSALVTLLGVAAVALTAKLIFRSPLWWSAVLFLAFAPNWLIHSRTGFETVMMASFYACFLLCYLLYRTKSPPFLYAAVAFGAATFYTYSNGQIVMAVTALLLLVFDFPYHLRHWRTVLGGAVLAAVLALPILRFRLDHPESLTQHLRAIDSYWFKDIPLGDKWMRLLRTYAYGLSPQYWFLPNTHDLVRHRMKDVGHLSLFVAPFFVAGLVLCIVRVRSATHRALILCALAAPAGAALAEISITRVMAFNVPAALFCTLGLDLMVTFVVTRLAGEGGAMARRARTVSSVAVFVALSLASLALFRYALVGGLRWFDDYGLYGMQYGARQLFEETIPELLADEPEAMIDVSSTWANGTDAFLRFFLPKELHSRVQMLNVDHFTEARRALNDDTILIMTPEEYGKAVSSPKFKAVSVDRIIPYPDGRPGFYVARLEYADDLDLLLTQEREERDRPVTGEAVIDGQVVQVTHSLLDAGQLSDLFDGDAFTLARGMEANPLVFEFEFPEARAVTALKATFGSMDFDLTASLWGAGGGEPTTYAREFRGLPSDPTVDMTFDRGPDVVKRVRLEILQTQKGPAKIHVRDLDFLP